MSHLTDLLHVLEKEPPPSHRVKTYRAEFLWNSWWILQGNNYICRIQEHSEQQQTAELIAALLNDYEQRGQKDDKA